MSFKDDISEAKSKELNYFHKSNEDFADDIIESNTNCWSCQTDIPMGKKYCEMHCGHPADEFDSFTGQCKSCGKSLNVNMMMVMPSSETKATEAKIERSNGSMTIDGKQVIKIWESMQGWYWYAVEDQGEYTGVDADGNDVQAHAWFGYVQADFNEWGTFDSKELERAGVWTVPKSNWGWTGKMEESKASEFKPEDQGKMAKITGGVSGGMDGENWYYIGKTGRIASVGIFSDDAEIEIDGKRKFFKAGDFEIITESKANEYNNPNIEWIGDDYHTSEWKCKICGETGDNLNFGATISNIEDHLITHMLDGDESKASEDYGNHNRINQPDIQVHGFPRDAEGHARASWDKASIGNREYFLKSIGMTEDPYSPFYNLSKYTQGKLATYVQNNYLGTYESKASEANGYIAFYDGQQTEIYADTSYDAQQKAIDFFNPPESKKHTVTVIIAEQDGKQVTNTFTEGFIKDMNLDKNSLRNYDLDSLINMWKDAQAYYQNPDNTWEDEDAEFYDELAVVINEKKSSAGESEDVFMYDGTGDSDGVGYWWDFELPVDQMKHEQLSSILGIDINTAWGFMTPAEQDRIRNYKLNKSMTNEAQLMKEINDGWEFSVIDHGYGGGNMGNSPDVGLLEVGIFSPDTGDINGQKSAVQGYMTQADVDGLLSTFRTDPAVAFRSIGGEWTFAGQQGLEYQSHYSDMSDITWSDIETMEGSMTLLERNMWLENRFDEIRPEDFRRLADTARED